MRRIATIFALRYSINKALSHPVQATDFVKSLSTATPLGNGFDNRNNNNNNNNSSLSFETVDEFEQRIFGGTNDINGSNPNSDSFFQKLDRLERAHARNRPPGDEDFPGRDGLDESFDTLADGMDDKLKEASMYFEFDADEVNRDNYSFRADMSFWPGDTYTVEDLDLTKPRAHKPKQQEEFEVTTEEVLMKADFRNVRFLAKFITEAGIIIKRSKTGISAKAQRKVAREIKTARAFGLMPFTTMGTKSFIFGRTMEDLDEDYEYETFEAVDVDGGDLRGE